MHCAKKTTINKGQLTTLALALSGALAAMAPLSGNAQQVISTPSTPLSWSSSDLTITNAGAITSTGPTAAVITGGTVGTLSNSGSIIGGRQGVNNVGNTISAVINSGSISGNIFSGGIGVAGIANDHGVIQTLNNTIGGNIFGITGISNSGTINSLSNSGNIVGYYAIKVDQGTIGTLTNDGTINGYINPSYLGNQGIEVINGSIGTLTNNNYISGFYSGILAIDSTIGTLTNNLGGTINGQNFSAVEIDGGTIGRLNNYGLLSGSSGLTVTDDGNNPLQYGTLGMLNNGGTIQGGTDGVYNNGSIGTLNNLSGGAIIGGASGFGIHNDSRIGALSNSGLISGGTGIYNNGSGGGGTIGSLQNSGTINGNVGVLNFGGSISTLNNSGQINAVLGVFNTAAGTINASIDVLQNSGSINSSSTFSASSTSTLTNTIFGGGIINTAAIGTLTNSSLISSNASIDNSGSGTIVTGGIVNTGVITVLNNSGAIKTGSSISGSNAGSYVSAGIYNSGTIGTFNNLAGATISSQDTYGTDVVGNGFENRGSIGALNNAGLIRGVNSALSLDAGSTLGSLVNSGTIAGNVFNQSSNALTITGGSGSSFGTLTGFSGGIGVADIGHIYSTPNLTFGSGNQLLNDSITVNNGAGTVTNAGTLQVNNPLSISGNYVQNASASLVFGVSNPTANGNLTDTGYGRLLVSGNATLASGSTVSLKSLGYSFAQGQRYVVLAALGNITASGVNYSVTGFTVNGNVQTDTSNSSYRDLVLTLGGATGSSPVNYADNSNANASLRGLFNYSGNDPTLLALFNPAAAQNNPDAANQTGEKLGPSSVKGAATDAQGAVSQAVGNVANERMDGQRVAQWGSSGVATGEFARDIALWGQVFGGGATQGLRDNVSGYHANYRGLLMGVDGLVSEQLRVGGLASFAKTSISSDGNMSGSSADVNNYGLTAYASYSGAPWYVNVQAGASRQQYSTTRVVSFTGFSGVANGSFNGQQYSTSVLAGYPLNLDAWLPGATLTPVAGLSYSTLRQNGYTETGGNGAALTVGSSTSNSLKSELGAKLERSFDTSYGKLLPSLQLGWRHEYKDGRVQTGASFAADSTGSTAFVTQSAAPIANLGVLNLGLTLLQGKQLSLTARYTLESGGGYTAQTGSMQVRWQY